MRATRRYFLSGVSALAVSRALAMPGRELVALSGAASITIKDTAASPVYAPAGNWTAFQAISDFGSTRSQSMTVRPGSFPNKTVFNWSWPTDGATAVRSWNAVDFGNYFNTTPAQYITSSLISNLTKLTTTFNLSLSGVLAGANVTLDGFLFNQTDSQIATMVCEFQIYMHTPPSTKAFVDAQPSVGTYVSAAIGNTPSISWVVTRETANFFGTPYYLAYPVGGGDFMVGTFDLKAFFNYLVGQGKLTGAEHYNGHGLGVETLNGAGSLKINSVSAAYTTTTPIFPAATLPAHVQMFSTQNLTDATWQVSPGSTKDATGIQDIAGVYDTHSLFRSSSPTTASANHAYKFQIDFDPLQGWQWVNVQIFRQDYGAFTQAWFDLINLVAVHTDGGSLTPYSSDVQKLDNGRTRCFINFTTDASTTGIKLNINQALAPFQATYTGVAGKKLIVANPWLYDPLV